MAQLVIAAAGAAVGAATLGTGIVAMGLTGTAIGWMAGSMLGSMLQKGPNQQGPRLGDLRVAGTEYGQPIPWVAGSPRIAGQIVWASRKREIANTQKVGKGGGGSKVTTYTYEVDLLILLSENEISSVSRIWSNGELVWATNQTKAGVWSELRIYLGSDNQLPDPTYEAAVGAGNAPAYRGRGSVLIRSLQLGQSGQIPNLTFEVGLPGRLQNFRYWQGTDGPFSSTVYDTLDDVLDAGNAYFGVYKDQYLGFLKMNEGSDSVPDGLGDKPSYYPDGERIDFSEPLTKLVLIFTNYKIGNPASPNSLPPPDVTKGLIQDLPDSFVAVDGEIGNPLEGAWCSQLKASGFTSADAEGVMLINTLGANSLNGYKQSYRPGVYDGFGIVNACNSTTALPPQPTYALASPNLLIYAEFVPSQFVTLEIRTTIDELMERSGYAPDDYDLSGLQSETKPLRALAIGQVAPTRGTLEVLQKAWFFEASKSDRIYIRPRSTASLVTIPWSDLGVGDDIDSDREPLALQMGSDLEIPAQVALSYNNMAADYNIATEHSDRLISGQESTASIQMPLGMLPVEAKGVADALLFDQLASLISTTIRLPLKYAYLEPGDVFEAVNFDGRTYRLRVLSKKDTLSTLEMECVLDDVGALQSAAVTDTGYISVAEPVRVAPTLFEALDIPILRDADNDSGYYAAVAADRDSEDDEWDGAVFVQAFTAGAFAQEFITAESCVMGACLTTLGNWTGGNVFDETNTLNVEVVGELESSTRDLMLADLSINAMLIGSELIRFRLATLLSANGARRTYRLSSLLRGQRGTEWAVAGHVASERCVLLNAALRRVPGLLTQIGLQRDVKAVTLNALLSDVDDQSFTNDAVGLKPFSPANVVALADGANLRVTWQRRTRLSVRYGGAVDQVVPLGEASEQYRVRIFDGLTLVRTATVTATEYLYTSLAADGFAAGDPVTVEVSQLSAIVGAGYPTTTTGIAP